MTTIATVIFWVIAADVYIAARQKGFSQLESVGRGMSWIGLFIDKLASWLVS